MYFWKPLIEHHQNDINLIGDYYGRTLVVFKDINKEAEKYAEELYANYPATEETDPASVAEWAHDEGIERYQTLLVMKSNHLLMSVSLLYHVWEQQLIKFTLRELQRYFKLDKKSMSFSDVLLIFRIHGVELKLFI